MTRRGCVMLLATALLSGSLPACSSFSGSLFKSTSTVGDNPTADAKNKAVEQAHREQAWAESEKHLVPPAPPVDANSTGPAPLGAADQRVQDLPPGQRLPEFTGPPPTLVTRDLPQPLPLDQTSVHPVVGQLDTKPDPAACEQPAEKKPLVEAIKCVLAKRPAAALECLKPFDGNNRDLCMRFLAAVELLADKDFDQLTPAEKAALEAQFKDLEIALQNRGLTIDNMCLCERLDGYGEYQPVPPGHAFHAETPRHCGDRVQVYVELSNIAAEQRGNVWVTTLNSTISVYDDQGARVWFYNYRPEPPLQSTVARSVCSRTYDFLVPKMDPGKFTLTMEITDETRLPHRVAHKSVEFIVAPPG